MRILAANNEGYFLDDHLKCHAQVVAEPSLLIYYQFLTQLRLPVEKWQFEKGSNFISVEQEPEMELFDPVMFKSIDVKRLVSPLRLFTYYLLQQYLGKSNVYDGLGLIHERKSRFVFLTTSFDVERLVKPQFEVDDMGRFVFKHLKKQELQQTLESFFVLMDEKLEPKLQLVLTQYHSETGIAIDKTKWIADVLNMNRLAALKTFMYQQFERL